MTFFGNVVRASEQLFRGRPSTEHGAGQELPRFTQVLPYEQYEASSCLYGRNADGPAGNSISFCLECLPQIGSSEQLESSLQNLPQLLPVGATLQVAMYADANISEQLGRYCRLRRGAGAAGRAGGIHRQLARFRFHHYSTLSGDLVPRNFRMFVSVSCRGELSNPTTRKKCLELMKGLCGLLASCAIPAQPLQPDNLISLVGAILNPHCARRRLMPYDPQEPLAEQCLLRDTRIEVNSNSLTVAGDGKPHALCALCATGYPAAMRLAGMSALLGDPLRPNLAYPGPFIITMCARSLDPEAESSLVALRSARAAANANSQMARLMPNYYRRQHEDWNLASEVLGGGGNLVLLSHHIVVQAPPAQIAAAVEAARAIWRAGGFTLAVTEYMQVQGLLAALPLTLSPAFAEDLLRSGWMSRKSIHNIGHSMPSIAEWKGTRNPALLMLGRRGQVIGMDLFDSAGNYNAVVSGASGTGKSVLLNEIASSYLGQGAQVWIMDIGCSYQHSCELLGGQFIRFQATSGIRLNPFSSVLDINEDIRLLKPLFAQMIAPSGLGDYQRARLEEALLATWTKHGPQSCPTRLRETLLALAKQANDSRITDMATMLGPYCQGGAHGRWFQGTANINFNAPLIVLELEELKSDPNLQAVILLQLMFLIGQKMYLARDQRKLVIIDEAWALLHGEGTAEFIENGYRRARKYNGAFLSAAQSLADFFVSPAARATIINSDWMLLLSQKAEEITRLCGAGQLELSAHERELLLSLRTEPGRYAELLVRAGGKCCSIARLVIDPFTQLLFSTRAEDHQAIATHRQQGFSVSDAVVAVLADRKAAGDLS